MNKFLSLLGVASICGAYASCTPNLMSDRSVKKVANLNSEYSIIYQPEESAYYIPYQYYKNYYGYQNAFNDFVDDWGISMYGYDLSLISNIDEYAGTFIDDIEYGYCSYWFDSSSDFYDILITIINELPHNLVIFSNIYMFAYGGDLDSSQYQVVDFELDNYADDDSAEYYYIYKNYYSGEFLEIHYYGDDSFNMIYYVPRFDMDYVRGFEFIYSMNIYNEYYVDDYGLTMFGAWYIKDFIYSFTAFQQAFNSNWDNAYNLGYQNALDKESSAIFDDGYNKGFDKAYNEQQDRIDALNVEWNRFVNEREQDGYQEGYALGFREGKAEGYDEGVNENFEFMSVFNKFFNLELFPGFRMYYILLVGLGIGIFAIVMKMVFK